MVQPNRIIIAGIIFAGIILILALVSGQFSLTGQQTLQNGQVVTDTGAVCNTDTDCREQFTDFPGFCSRETGTCVSQESGIGEI